MKLRIQVKTRAKKESIDIVDDLYIVKVRAMPVDGEANKRVIELLAAYLDRPKSSLEIVQGHKSKIKLIELKD